MTQPANPPGYPRGRPRRLELAMVPYYRSRGLSARRIGRLVGVSHVAVLKHLRRCQAGNQSGHAISVGEKQTGNQTPLLDLPGKVRRANLLSDTCTDVGQIAREAVQARAEIAKIVESGLTGRLLEEALSSPMSRLELVRRWAADGIERHGWRPYQASAGALGSGRPLDGSRRKPEGPEQRQRRAK